MRGVGVDVEEPSLSFIGHPSQAHLLALLPKELMGYAK